MEAILVEPVYQGPWWCPMCGPGGAWGWGMGAMALFWVVLLGLVIWLLFQLVGRGRPPGGDAGTGRAEEILKERYARGEIDREAYQRILDDLRQGPPS